MNQMPSQRNGAPSPPRPHGLDATPPFPRRAAALAQEFSDASRALAHLGVTEPPPGEAAW